MKDTWAPKPLHIISKLSRLTCLFSLLGLPDIALNPQNKSNCKMLHYVSLKVARECA